MACVGPLKKSGSPNVMCSAPGRDLRVDVGEHDVRLHDAELAVVDRHDRAMPAQMLAAAARFGVRRRPFWCRPASAARRSAQRRQARRSGTRNCRRGIRCGAGLQPCVRSQRLKACADFDPSRNRTKFPRTRRRARRRRRAIAAIRVQRRVEPVRADARRRIQRRTLAITGPPSRVAVCIGR